MSSFLLLPVEVEPADSKTPTIPCPPPDFGEEVTFDLTSDEYDTDDGD